MITTVASTRVWDENRLLALAAEVNRTAATPEVEGACTLLKRREALTGPHNLMAADGLPAFDGDTVGDEVAGSADRPHHPHGRARAPRAVRDRLHCRLWLCRRTGGRPHGAGESVPRIALRLVL